MNILASIAKNLTEARNSRRPKKVTGPEAIVQDLDKD